MSSWIQIDKSWHNLNYIRAFYPIEDVDTGSWDICFEKDDGNGKIKRQLLNENFKTKREALNHLSSLLMRHY